MKPNVRMCVYARTHVKVDGGKQRAITVRTVELARRTRSLYGLTQEYKK